MTALISIALPSWNGRAYIGAATRSVLDQPFRDLELVVSVDKSDASAIEIITSFSDPRLKVINPPRDLSMAEHYEWCLQHVEGEWVTILGQDDGLMPHFSRCVREALGRYKSVDALSFRRAYFFWPGCESLYGKRGVQLRSTNAERTVNSSRMLAKCLRGTAQHYDLPELYTNTLVRRSTVDAIRDSSQGRFYHEMTPDVYSGVAIALHVGEYVRLDYPVFWTGTSPNSTGFALGSSSTRHETQLSVSVRRKHLEAAERSKLGVSEIVGRQLWLESGSSSLFTLSAMDSVPFRSARVIDVNVVRTAFGSAVAQLLLSFLPSFPAVRNKRRVWELIRQQVKAYGINFALVLLRALCLLPLQLLSGTWMRVKDRLPWQTSSWIVQGGRFASLDHVNQELSLKKDFSL